MPYFIFFILAAAIILNFAVELIAISHAVGPAVDALSDNQQVALDLSADSTYDSGRNSSSSWGVTGREDCSFCEETVATGLTLGPMNGHASQSQRTPVLCLAEHSSSVLTFTEHARCFSNTEISIHRLLSPVACWLGRSLFLDPFLLEPTLPFWHQLRTSRGSATSCPFTASPVSHLCLQTALATALLLRFPPSCVPLPWPQLFSFKLLSSARALHRTCQYSSDVRVYLH